MGFLNKKYLMALALAAVLVLGGCDKEDDGASQDSGEPTMQTQLFGDEKNSFGNVEAPSDFDWRQCEGVVLDFIVEDNINANILSRECEKFTEATGIKVNIKSMEFNTLVEKINMEFIARTEQYELIYVDPYQTLNRFSDSLENLNIYQQDDSLPHIVGGLDSFKEEQLEICSYFGDQKELRAIPFDTTTMIFFYRKDIFDKYKEEMIRDLGYEPEPGLPSFTWERYIEVSRWITGNVPDEEVEFGSLSMDANHNSIYAEFSNVLNSYGGDYFTDKNVSSLGIEMGMDIQADTPEFLKALSIYKEMAALNPVSNEEWTWSNVTEAFQAGRIAMMANWDENVVAVENEELSAVAGKVGYSVLPFGSGRSSNIYGGSGIGINSNASQEKKLASWLFIVWATSPQIQMKTFLEEEGGNMPSRKDLTRLIEAKYITSQPHAFAMIKAQSKNSSYYRPKMKEGYSFETIMTNNLYQMVRENLDVKTVSQNIESQWMQTGMKKQ